MTTKPICPNCGRRMHRDTSEVCEDSGWAPWVCDKCDEEAAYRGNEAADWNDYHHDGLDDLP